MITLDLVQVIVQGGAVGLLLAFGYLGYKLANRLITVGVGLLSNHLTHIEQAILKLNDAINRLERK